MDAKPDDQQESRTEKAAISLTPSEDRAIRFIVLRKKTTVSEFIRERARLPELVVEYDRLMAALDEIDPADDAEAA